MVGFLIIAHAPLASALKTLARHTFPDCGGLLEVLDVASDTPPEVTEARGLDLLTRVRNPDAIIFTDVFGATPCNVSQRLAARAEGGLVRVITGVSVPMLWRSLCYAHEPIDAVLARAATGALQGVIQPAISRPQNQTHMPMAHDQNQHQHQQ